MPRSPAIYRRPGARPSGRTVDQDAYRLWYMRLPWTDKKGGGLRGVQLGRKPLCEECEKEGVVTAATDVDHRIPHRGSWELFVDETNLVSLCHSHHSRKTGRGG